MLHLQAEPDGPVVPYERRRRHRQQRAEYDSPVAADTVGQAEPSSGSRHDLAHGDHIALTCQAFERPADVQLGRARRTAVAGLVPAPGATRARLTRADVVL